MTKSPLLTWVASAATNTKCHNPLCLLCPRPWNCRLESSNLKTSWCLLWPQQSSSLDVHGEGSEKASCVLEHCWSPSVQQPEGADPEQLTYFLDKKKKFILLDFIWHQSTLVTAVLSRLFCKRNYQQAFHKMHLTCHRLFKWQPTSELILET